MAYYTNELTFEPNVDLHDSTAHRLEGKGHDGPVRVLVLRAKSPAGSRLDEVVERQLRKERVAVEGFEILGSRAVEAAGVPALDISLQYVAGKSDCYQRDLHFMRDGVLFRLGSTGTMQDRDTVDDVVDRALSSLRWRDAVHGHRRSSNATYWTNDLSFELSDYRFTDLTIHLFESIEKDEPSGFTLARAPVPTIGFVEATTQLLKSESRRLQRHETLRKSELGRDSVDAIDVADRFRLNGTLVYRRSLHFVVDGTWIQASAMGPMAAAADCDVVVDGLVATMRPRAAA